MLFQRLRELAQVLPDPADEAGFLHQPIGEEYRHGLALCFDEAGEWATVRATQPAPESVVYRRGPSGNHGSDFTPCSRLSQKSSANAVARLGRGVANLLEHAPDLDPKRREWLGRVRATLGDKTRREAVVEEADAVLASLLPSGRSKEKEEGAFLYVARLGNHHEIEPVYAWPEVGRALLRRAIAGWSKCKAQDGFCAVCGAGPGEVFGSFNELACYNLDKKGTIVGGFQEGAAARNFPVCRSCALRLSHAISYARDRLSAQSYGCKYLVLPACPDEEGRGFLREELQRHPDRLRLARGRDLLAQEEDLLALGAELAREQGRGLQLAYDLVFYKGEKNKNLWRVLEEVHHVPPERLRAIHEAANAIAREPLFERRSKKGITPLRLDTGLLARLAWDEVGKNDRRQLRAWLCAVVAGRRLLRAPLLRQLTRAVLAASRKEAFPAGLARALEAWAFLLFLDQLELLSIPTRHTMDDPWIPESPYGRYCAEHPQFFDRQELIAAFLVGCYCSVVASVQYTKRKTKPFEQRYRGRLLERSALERLYREGQDKLARYEARGHVAKDLEPDVAESFVRCGSRWRATRDELTFAFTLGLSLQARIAEREREAAAQES